jgi:hypothetical protein
LKGFGRRDIEHIGDPLEIGLLRFRAKTHEQEQHQYSYRFAEHR